MTAARLAVDSDSTVGHRERLNEIANAKDAAYVAIQIFSERVRTRTTLQNRKNTALRCIGKGASAAQTSD
jgi:hypothetical protein